MSQTPPTADIAVSETPLAHRLTAAGPSVPPLRIHRGARTPECFSSAAEELQALLRSAGIYDLGFRSILRVTGKDRVRWMNGMITQTVRGLTPGQLGYTLVLNPQGRMQGDGDVFCYDDFLLLETDRSQADRLITHLRRYIIMDDVKLEPLDDSLTALGIAGPNAARILESLGAAIPEEGAFQSVQLAGIETTLAHRYSPVVPCFEIHLSCERVLDLWNALLASGAAPCGVESTEQFRILQGIPLFDVDFSDKHLPQEAGLHRALNFTKGCYIGQEIVERIRARATVHRSLRQFQLEGVMPPLGPGQTAELRSGDAAVGEITSFARIELPGLMQSLALGIARVEALDRSLNGSEPIRCAAGIATPLAAPPKSADLQSVRPGDR